MRISQVHYAALRECLVLRFTMTAQPYHTMRERWDLLHESGFDTRPLYAAGLDDSHIDTALRAIGKEWDAAYEESQ